MSSASAFFGEAVPYILWVFSVPYVLIQSTLSVLFALVFSDAMHTIATLCAIDDKDSFFR